jgi:decaprenylphospho-beta-D-erythro-pentofuranosid-2-ulose 2-reductase
MKKIVVFGATSDIALGCIKLWIDKNYDLILVSRNKTKLNSFLKDINSKKIHKFFFDMNDFDNHDLLLQKIYRVFGHIDFFFFSYGVNYKNKICLNDFKYSKLVIDTNFTSYISMLNLISRKLKSKKNGTIGVISSVAGDRGRSQNFIYASSKSAISTYLSGLRQELYEFNIRVIDFKIGPVKTTMTKNFKNYNKFSDIDIISKNIVKSFENNKTTIYLPSYWRTIMFFIKLLPDKVFLRLRNLINTND